MRMTLAIREILPATPRARIVRLDLNRQPFEYAAGQAVLVAAGNSHAPRPYSIAAAPEDARRDDCLELLVATTADGVAGPHLPLLVGTRVEVDGPHGTFTFPARPNEQQFVFIAGGTGIAPLRAMLRHALTVPHRAIGLFYSARTPDEFAYEGELRALAHGGRIELRQTITRGAQSDWSGSRGRIDRAALEELVHDPATLCFVCGPAAMVDDVPKLLGGIGVAAERIKVEEWSAA